MTRPEGDEEEVIFDENEDADDDEADIDAVSLVHEFEFCYISLRICLGLTVLEITVGHWTFSHQICILPPNCDINATL